MIKNIHTKKRFSAIFHAIFSVVLIAALILNCSVAGISAASYNTDEADTAPVVFDAVKEYNTASASEGPYWYYQYAQNYLEPEWEYCGRYSWNCWMNPASANCGYTGIYYNGKMQIQNVGGQLDEKLPATAYLYVPDSDGVIEMLGSPSLEILPVAAENALVRITVNGENVYPETGWIKLNSTTKTHSFEGVEFSVKKNDQVRFEFACENYITSGSSARVKWNPALLFYKSKPVYTEKAGILSNLTEYMYNLFSGLTGEVMDESGTDAKAAAIKEVSNSNYGQYSPLDAIYNNTILESSDASVWKFAVAEDYGVNFKTPNTNMAIDAFYYGTSLDIEWFKPSNGAIPTLRTVDSQGVVRDYTITSDYIQLKNIDKGETIRVQLSYGELYSEVVEITTVSNGRVNVNTVSVGTKYYLNNITAVDGGSNSERLDIGSSDVDSKYSFYNSFDEASTNKVEKRRIEYKFDDYEKMSFGFTAPHSGDYEISAPVEFLGEGNVLYWLTKETADGEKVLLDSVKNTDSKATFCLVEEYLAAGDTVWFEAVGDSTASINIGIPRISLCSKTIPATGTYRHTFRAVDYVENIDKSDYSYGNISWAESSQAAWSFGYYKNPIVKKGNTTSYDGLGLSSYKAGTDASQLRELFTPYELISDGYIYNAAPASIKSESSVVNDTYAIAGNLYPCLSSDYANRHNLGPAYKSQGFFGCTGTVEDSLAGEKVNLGIYMDFTAPVSGNAVLNIADNAAAYVGDKLLVLKNNQVIKAASGNLPTSTVVNIGNIAEGDKITLVYARTKGSSVYYQYFGMPYITIEGQYATVSYDDAGVADKTVDKETEFNLASPIDSVGRRFVGWSADGGKTIIAENGSYTATTDTAFKAYYEYYGDTDNDGKVNSIDLLNVKHKLLNVTDEEYLNGDVNVNGNIDIRDMVRLKKWLSGLNIALGKSTAN